MEDDFNINSFKDDEELDTKGDSDLKLPMMNLYKFIKTENEDNKWKIFLTCTLILYTIYVF